MATSSEGAVLLVLVNPCDTRIYSYSNTKLHEISQIDQIGQNCSEETRHIRRYVERRLDDYGQLDAGKYEVSVLE